MKSTSFCSKIVKKSELVLVYLSQNAKDRTTKMHAGRSQRYRLLQTVEFDDTFVIATDEVEDDVEGSHLQLCLVGHLLHTHNNNNNNNNNGHL